MNKFNTKGIILSRTDYGEADRIITFLTPDHGKVKALARGVRKSKSKLAGGVELFSVSDIGILVGRGEINTLLSSRLSRHYGGIVKVLERTNLAFECIKQLDRATAEHPEEGYFNLLNQTFMSLDSEAINLDLIGAWFGAQLLKLAGRAPNLTTEKSGAKLIAGQKYDFNPDTMSFRPGRQYNTAQIKFLRLLFGANLPAALQKVDGVANLSAELAPLVKAISAQLGV